MKASMQMSAKISVSLQAWEPPLTDKPVPVTYPSSRGYVPARWAAFYVRAERRNVTLLERSFAVATYSLAVDWAASPQEAQ